MSAGWGSRASLPRAALSIRLRPPAAHPAPQHVHTPPLAAAAGPANLHNIHLSIAGRAPGGPARRQHRLRGGPGPKEGSGARGKGHLDPDSTQDSSLERGLLHPGRVLGSVCNPSQPEVEKGDRAARAKGALPARPHPLLIKAQNKEAAGKGGFDLTHLPSSRPNTAQSAPGVVGERGKRSLALQADPGVLESRC